MQVWLILFPKGPSDGNDLPPVFFYGEYFKFLSQYCTNVEGVSVFTPTPNVDMFQLHATLGVMAPHAWATSSI
jgi:hypothetical protein